MPITTKKSLAKLATLETRRWTFLIRIDDPIKGGHEEFMDLQPAFGNEEEAVRAGEAIRVEYSNISKYIGYNVSVTPIGHESVSEDTITQLAILEQNVTVQYTAALLVCERWLAGEIPPATTGKAILTKVWKEIENAMIARKKEPAKVAGELPTQPPEKVNLAELQKLAYEPTPEPSTEPVTGKAEITETVVSKETYGE